jgi:TetR/AcrR family transcriptional regulator, repressor for uid operon
MSEINPLKSAAEHSEERRHQILRAAMTCFARRGFHQTTMSDIGAEAQISVGLIYRYFESKDAVIAFMASEHMKDLRQMLEQARRAPNLFDALEIVFTCHCEEQPEHVHASFVMDLFAEASRNDNVRGLVRDVTEFFTDSVAQLIASSGESRGGPQRLRPREAAELIIDAAHGMMIRSITDSSILTATQIRQRQLAMLRRLWPLLFSRAAPAAPTESVPS